MSDLRYDRIIEAFREDTPGGALDTAGIRRRVLESLDRKPSRSRRRFGWLVPLAAVLAASAALAAGRVPVMRAWKAHVPWDRARPVDVSTRAESASAAAPTADTPPPRLAAPSVAVQQDEVLPSAEPARSRLPSVEPARSRPLSPALRSARRDRVSEPAAASDDSTGSDELELFTAARRLHVEDSDPARAAGAWDAYLRAFPSGRLAVEARFNRALCLVKAGRTKEAEQALASFAAGEFGSYRRTDAETLLRLLHRAR